MPIAMAASDDMRAMEASLLEAVAKDATDESRSVYADWLEEKGKKDQAEYIRLELRMRALSEKDPMHDELHRRFDRLSRVLDRAWKAKVARPEPEKEEPAPRVRIDINPAPRPPRPPPVAPAPTAPAAGSSAVSPELDVVPTRSVLSQVFGDEGGSASKGRKECRKCGVAMDSSESKCPSCGTRQFTRLRTFAFVVVVLTLFGFAIREAALDLLYQAKDDNFAAGRRERRTGCGR